MYNRIRVMVFNATFKNKYFSYIVVVSFIGRGNLSTRRKPLTCSKSLTNNMNNRSKVKINLLPIKSNQRFHIFEL